MILHENAPGPLVRFGEQEVAGRRIVARLVPSVADPGPPSFRFDPVERRFLARAAGRSGPVGPSPPETWSAAVERGPSGPVLVGPGGAVPGMEAAYRAAAEGAERAGRGVYLLDPDPETLSALESGVFVGLFVSRPGEPAPAGLSAAAARGIPAGILLPVLPDWTDASGPLERAVEAAAASGASFAAGILAADDGPARRSMVEARAELDPGGPEDFFERVHHRQWAAGLEAARRRIQDACARLALSPLPPRAVGLAQPRGNARAAGRLEERADAFVPTDEHRASLFHAAVRWIDESERDLAAIAREGNFRKIFPFPEEVAAAAEGGLGEGS